MKKNLRNVAIPGTGIPLSVFCFSKFFAYIFLLFIYPLVAFVAAVNAGRTDFAKIIDAYREQLLTPQDWFSFWRLNCRLASYTCLVTQAEGFKHEDKWTFLLEGAKKGIPVTPWLDIPGVVVKDKNEEGGMGIHFYKNALNGGSWIIQEILQNDDFISGLLPSNAPLSTFRLITASQAPSKNKGKTKDNILVLSCVFRAGRAGAATDHQSVLFNVDMSTGTIGAGTTNSHWYQLGLNKIWTTPWTSAHVITSHPDTNKLIQGTKIPNFQNMVQLVHDGHRDLLLDVPIVGWDVAFTQKGILILEVNLSCNFFRGSFDQDLYFQFVEDYFLYLEERRLQNE